MAEEIEVDEDSEEEMETVIPNFYNKPEDVEITIEPSCSDRKLTIPRNCRKRELIPWTLEQKNLVKVYFENHIENKIPPKKKECELLISNNSDIFANKSVLSI